jgi:23S rRNA-intervening sequence protein
MSEPFQFSAEAPILRRTTDLYKEFYGYLKTFPKKDQYLLGKRCEDTILEFMEALIVAAGAPKEQKLQILQGASAKFDILKILFRLAREFKMLDNKKYLSLETKAQEIGRMLGGWIKSSNAKTPF